MKRAFAAFAFGVALAAQGQTPPVKIEGAWARASVQGQSGTGAFMRITASEPLSLVGVSSPVAGVAEVHEMKMEGDVMKMRALPALALAPGKTVELKPGGYHLMLMSLKSPLKPDSQVPLTLTFRDAQGRQSALDLSVPVSVRAPDGKTPAHRH
ncbi:copper chaperone PCu(A)C [Ramlibacter sp.]|uniref:copper chaperone PCu(A)C n=1 Tax=Ramlibacter sp. TaxID=1917967 RepID=UPI003D0AE549